MVVAREEEFFSPLTKDQAVYICDVLNFQSQQAYLDGMKKVIRKAQKAKSALNKVTKVKKKNFEQTKEK